MALGAAAIEPKEAAGTAGGAEAVPAAPAISRLRPDRSQDGHRPRGRPLLRHRQRLLPLRPPPRRTARPQGLPPCPRRKSQLRAASVRLARCRAQRRRRACQTSSRSERKYWCRIPRRETPAEEHGLFPESEGSRLIDHPALRYADLLVAERRHLSGWNASVCVAQRRVIDPPAAWHSGCACCGFPVPRRHPDSGGMGTAGGVAAAAATAALPPPPTAARIIAFAPESAAPSPSALRSTEA